MATTAEEPRSPAASAALPIHVLIVDDDRPILASLAEGLRKAGFRVSEASNGQDALEIALGGGVDVGLLDVRMPGMSGLDLARELKEKTRLPFLFMSAHGEADVIKDATEFGALGYLLKPLRIPQVVPAIQAALARGQEIRKLRETEVNLNAALAQGRETSIAIGIIMERNRVDRQGAFEILRISARSQRRKMNEVAEQVVNATEVVNLMR